MIRLKLSLVVLIAVFLMFPTLVQAQSGSVCRSPVSVAPTTAEEDQPVTVTIDFHNCTGRIGFFQIMVDVTPTASTCASFAETFWVGGQVFPDKTSVFTHTFPAPKCASTYNVSFNGVVRATLTVVPVTTTGLTLKVTSPMNNSTVTNPVHVAAMASGPNPISEIEVWVNFKEVFHVSGGTLNTNLTLPVGSGERFVVQAVDSKGSVAKVVDSITISAVTTTSLTLKVTSPMNNSTVTNPVHVAATASGPNPISEIEVWVNFKEVFHMSGGTLNTNVTLPVGSGERFVVQAVDSKGNAAKVVDSITVKATGQPSPGTLTGFCFGQVQRGAPLQCGLVQDLTDCPVGKTAVQPTDVEGCRPPTNQFLDISASCHGTTITGRSVKGQCVVARQ